MKYVKFIFGCKVLNYESHLTYFQFFIYRKIIEISLEDLNCTCITKLAQEQGKKNWMDEKLFSLHCKGFFYTLSSFWTLACFAVKNNVSHK